MKTDDLIRLNATKKRSGDPYVFSMTGPHWTVLETLAALPGLSDHELTFLTDKHMIAAARCRLRDAGLVEQVATNQYGMTWKLTAEGEKFLDENGGKR